MFEKICKVSLVSALILIALFFIGIVMFNFTIIKIGAIGSITLLIVFLIALVLDNWNIK